MHVFDITGKDKLVIFHLNLLNHICQIKAGELFFSYCTTAVKHTLFHYFDLGE